MLCQNPFGRLDILNNFGEDWVPLGTVVSSHKPLLRLSQLLKVLCVDFCSLLCLLVYLWSDMLNKAVQALNMRG